MQQAVLNVNVVLRWEFRLGSILYLVYARAQAPDWAPAVTGGVGGAQAPTAPALSATSLLGNRGATDTLMLKLAYWWG